MDAFFEITLYYPERGIIVWGPNIPADDAGVNDGDAVFRDGASPQNSPIRRIDYVLSSDSVNGLVENSNCAVICGALPNCRQDVINAELSTIQYFKGDLINLTYMGRNR